MNLACCNEIIYRGERSAPGRIRSRVGITCCQDCVDCCFLCLICLISRQIWNLSPTLCILPPVTKISFAKNTNQLLKGAGTLAVIGSESAWKSDTALPKSLPRALRNMLHTLAAEVKAGANGGSASTLYKEPKRLVAAKTPDGGSRYLGVGRPDTVQKVVSAAGLASQKKKVAILCLVEDAQQLLPMLNAIGRALPMFTRKTSKSVTSRVVILAANSKGEIIDVPAAALETLNASREAARLVDTPPTEMNPEAMAAEVEALLADIPGVKTEVLVGDELVEAGLMGIHSVGRCALNAPRMLVATYEPEDAKGAHIALVGKGVTFDTGGLNLKISGSMSNMKCDMGGAAAVTGAFCVLTKTNAKRKLSLVVCLAENAIGPDSFKPDDILTMHSGQTVEINNTDAEGRLLLADGVSYAGRVLKADIVLDAATLTGAQMIATGVHVAAVMSNDAEVEDALVAAGRATGDLAHPLPFAPELFKSEFASLVADMKNSVKNRLNAQSSCAGQFIFNHLAKTKVRWGHVDLAGPAFRGDRGTGFGVALLSDVVSRL